MILLRHGQTPFNVHFGATRIDPGIPDPELTETGRAQAKAAAAALRGRPVKRLIASPYVRALRVKNGETPGSSRIARLGDPC